MNLTKPKRSAIIFSFHGELSEWSKVQHSKECSQCPVSSPPKPLIYKGFRWFILSDFYAFLAWFSCIFPQNIQHFHSWRRIEVVITSSTRNRVVGDEPARGFDSHRLRQRSASSVFCLPILLFYACQSVSDIPSGIGRMLLIFAADSTLD